MNDQTGPEPAAVPQPEPAAQPGTDAPPLPPRSFSRAAAEGFRAARADAERAARAAAPKVRAGFGRAAYDLSYISAFGAFFGFTLLREMLPEAVKNGLSAGAKRGQQAAENVGAAEAVPG